MEQPDFILKLNAKLSKADSEAIQEALNKAYTLGYYAALKPECEHSFVIDINTTKNACGKCGISFSEWHDKQ